MITFYYLGLNFCPINYETEAFIFHLNSKHMLYKIEYKF